jgi:hypothetical protein
VVGVGFRVGGGECGTVVFVVRFDVGVVATVEGVVTGTVGEG